MELQDYLPADDPRDETRRRLRLRARNRVQRDLEHEIRKAPKDSEAAKFLEQVRCAVYD